MTDNIVPGVVYSGKSGTMSKEEEIAWLGRLRTFVSETLKPILPEDNLRGVFVNDANMAIWAQAFTHETYSPDTNYEKLEFLGDGILKGLFPKYLIQRFPKYNEDNYTAYNTFYMSKSYQSGLSDMLHLSDYIRISGYNFVPLKIKTDIFESFFGALDTVSDAIIPGIGFANAYNMLVYLFNNIQFDADRRFGAAKTQVDQIFTRFGLGKPLTKEIEINSKLHQKQVILTDEQLRFLQSYGVAINNAVIANATATTKKEADINAYIEALQTLNSYGITREWAGLAKNASDLATPEIQPYLPAVNQRLQREGYVADSIYFEIPKKTVTTAGSVVQLVGVKPDGSHNILAYIFSLDNKGSHSAEKLALIRYYATGQQ